VVDGVQLGLDVLPPALVRVGESFRPPVTHLVVEELTVGVGGVPEPVALLFERTEPSGGNGHELTRGAAGTDTGVRTPAPAVRPEGQTVGFRPPGAHR
jgi:hypothetical protein